MDLNTTVFMCSGQGSQYFQMGRALYDGDDTFREWMIELDDIARGESGKSVIETLYSDAHCKGDPFDRTLLTHPAIFMVEYSLAQSLMRAGVRPDIVLGVSLGSFAAAAVAGFIDVEDALTAVARQAIALEEWCEPGGMIAVLADRRCLRRISSAAEANWRRSTFPLILSYPQDRRNSQRSRLT